MIQPQPVLCALDRPDLDGSLTLADAVRDVVGGFKVGLEFTTANGPEGVRKVVARGQPVFLDLKFHDIPNTVAGAVRVAAGLGVAMMTLHVAGGPAMLRAAVAARDAASAGAGERPWLLGVTVLTSVDSADLAAIGVPESADRQVLRLAALAATCGLDGVICSPHEIAALRHQFGGDLKLVVPGIRPEGSATADQKRTLSPGAAVAAGADWLVIGRPITAAPDPHAAAAAIAAEIDRAAAA